MLQGAGAFEVAARQYLINEVKKTVQGVWLSHILLFRKIIEIFLMFVNFEQRAQLGVEAFADALLVVPKTLAENSGLDTQDVIIGLVVLLSVLITVYFTPFQK